jgi:hypothetical protein
MQNHFIHYHQRRIRVKFPHDINDPWFAEVQANDRGFSTPRFHVTRSTNGVAMDVKSGDTIWLVSQLYSPWGKLPPALDARIDVADCELRNHGGKGFRYRAAATSHWFPLSDCSKHLLNLKTIAKDGKLNPLLKNSTQPIGYSLQSIRKLSSGEPLCLLEKELTSKDMHFISYRIKDGTQGAFEKAKSLIHEGIPFFWDRWSLPRRLAERREIVSDERLDSHIKETIRISARIWGIETPEYAANGSYSLIERCLAMELGKYHPVEQ